MVGLHQPLWSRNMVVHMPLTSQWQVVPARRGGELPRRRRVTQCVVRHQRRRRWKRRNQGPRGAGRGVGAANSGTRTGRKGSARCNAHIRIPQRRKVGIGKGGSHLTDPFPSPHRQQTFGGVAMGGTVQQGQRRCIHGTLGQKLQRAWRRLMIGPPRSG